jgi:hypothetical protein
VQRPDQRSLPVKNATSGVNRQEYSMNGSVVEVTTTPAHQVMAGMPEKANVSSMAVRPRNHGGLQGHRPEPDLWSPLRSGFLLGEST